MLVIKHERDYLSSPGLLTHIV